MSPIETVIFIALFNFFVLAFAFKNKKYLYTRTPEKQWEPILNEFDSNKKQLEDLDVSDYKLGSGHLYH